MAHRSNTLRASTLFLAAAALVASGAAARADQVVYFVNGKAITVKKVEKGDRLTILEIEGGGRIGIPTVQIERIEELALPTAVPQVAVPAILPAPQPAPQAVNQAPPPPAPASTRLPAGPGTGGHVDTNTPAGGAKPLAFGGEPSDDVIPARPRPGFQSTPPGSGGSTAALAPGRQVQRNSNMMTGGPGAYQRGRPGARNGKSGRQPAPAGAPAGQPGAAQQPPPGTSPIAPPPTASAPPPPPPPPDPAEADPAEADPGSSDGSADDGAAPETGTDEPASGDGDSGQN